MAKEPFQIQAGCSSSQHGAAGSWLLSWSRFLCGLLLLPSGILAILAPWQGGGEAQQGTEPAPGMGPQAPLRTQPKFPSQVPISVWRLDLGSAWLWD